MNIVARPLLRRRRVPGSGTAAVSRRSNPLMISWRLELKVIVSDDASAVKVPMANWPTPPLSPAVLVVKVTLFTAVAVVRDRSPLESLLHHSNSYFAPTVSPPIVIVAALVKSPAIHESRFR